jgi:hypothetical protein
MTAAPIFWPGWKPQPLPASVHALSLWQDDVQAANNDGSAVASSLAYAFNASTLQNPASVLAYGLDVITGLAGIEVLGAGAHAVGLSLDGGHSFLGNVPGAYVLMHGEPSITGANADTELTAVALRFGSFKLQGSNETLLINQAAGSPPASPSSGPDIVIDASGEFSADGRDTISINTSTLASTKPNLPDVFIHLGIQMGNVQLSGPGSAVVVGGAGAGVVIATNRGGTTLAFGSGPIDAWGGPGHNVFLVLASAAITHDIINDFKGAGGLKIATARLDPFSKPGADLLEASTTLETSALQVTQNQSGTLVSFSNGHDVLLAGVSHFSKADIHWIANN